MYTAKDMKKDLENVKLCEGLDEWLQTDLLNKMAIKGKEAVVPSRELHAKGWDFKAFVREMTRRDFNVRYECDDRPCSEPYYIISV